MDLDALDLDALRRLGYSLRHLHRDARSAAGAETADHTHATRDDGRSSVCGLELYSLASTDASLLTCPTCCARARRALTQAAHRARRTGVRFNPSNEAGSCLWCGWKLRPHGAGGIGRHGHGLFCTATCGEQFAHAAARNGYRFEPRGGKKKGGTP